MHSRCCCPPESANADRFSTSFTSSHKAARRADRDDDEHDFNPFQQHRLERGQAGDPVEPLRLPPRGFRQFARLALKCGVLVVQMATGTLSPRFMRLWYQDGLQKLVLATFVGTLTFSFSLLRHVEENSVPDIGVTVAGLLTAISLLLAVLLWVAIAAEKTSEIALSAPVELQNVPKDLELTGDTVNAIEVRLRSSPGIIERLAPGEVAARIDLRGAAEGERIIHLTEATIRVPFGIKAV